MSVTAQYLLKRRAGTTTEEFRESYLRHGRVVIPWCLALGVQYYAQIHRPSWSSTQAEQKYWGVTPSKWDAAAEMAFGQGESGAKADQYYGNFILPDERRLLLSEALEHAQAVEPGSVVGERIEYIRDGKPLVEYGEWQKMFDDIDKTG